MNRTYKITFTKDGKKQSFNFATPTQAAICSSILHDKSPLLSAGTTEEKVLTHKEFHELSVKKFNV